MNEDEGCSRIENVRNSCSVVLSSMMVCNGAMAQFYL